MVGEKSHASSQPMGEEKSCASIQPVGEENSCACSQPMGEQGLDVEQPHAHHDLSHQSCDGEASTCSEAVAEDSQGNLSEQPCPCDATMQRRQACGCSSGRKFLGRSLRRHSSACKCGIDEECHLLAKDLEDCLDLHDEVDVPQQTAGASASEDSTLPSEQQLQDIQPWRKQSSCQLQEMNVQDLRRLLQKIKLVVQDVSTELVAVLQERQTWLEETDIRHLAIEQMLKAQDKLLWRLSEPLTVQMSIVLPDDEQATHC